ncbi:hypothetical protein JW707_05095 [Candidatus Woesearchaeota archaeon]|nr:hypothetical protein [Candidatus Woesearchaeota archaeon]
MPDSGNLRIENNQLTISVNPKLYPLEAVYSAAYVFMDRAYIVLDGDPDKGILVKMKLKKEGSLETLGNEFNNELLNYSDYLTRAKETKIIRELLLQRAIITNDSSVAESIDFDELENLEEEFLDDPEGIAIPWEEKYGKDENKPE